MSCLAECLSFILSCLGDLHGSYLTFFYRLTSWFGILLYVDFTYFSVLLNAVPMCVAVVLSLVFLRGKGDRRCTLVV